jgi:subtilisin family serine protease
MNNESYVTDVNQNHFKLINLHSLMSISRGNPEVTIGIIDGPADLNHPAFRDSLIRTVKDRQTSTCKSIHSAACLHCTFLLGILCAKRGTPAPAISPDCKIILRPIFIGDKISSTPDELSDAIIETIDAGARVINLSIGASSPNLTAYKKLNEVYDLAIKRGVILVVAAGNQGRIGYIPLLDNEWIIPVAACDNAGRFMPISNSGQSVGNRGVMAPGMNIMSTAPGEIYVRMSGTSISSAFVTGAIALLWSIFPTAKAVDIHNSIILTAEVYGQRTIIPGRLNAESAWKYLRTRYSYQKD